jgi:DNA-binding NtrC family response regulator
LNDGSEAANGVLVVGGSGTIAYQLSGRRNPHKSADGWSLAWIVANRNIPLIMMSGHPDAKDICQEFSLAGLDKPFGGLTALQQEVRRVLQDKQASVETCPNRWRNSIPDAARR